MCHRGVPIMAGLTVSWGILWPPQVWTFTLTSLRQQAVSWSGVAVPHPEDNNWLLCSVPGGNPKICQCLTFKSETVHWVQVLFHTKSTIGKRSSRCVGRTERPHLGFVGALQFLGKEQLLKCRVCRPSGDRLRRMPLSAPFPCVVAWLRGPGDAGAVSDLRSPHPTGRPPVLWAGRGGGGSTRFDRQKMPGVWGPGSGVR